MTFGNVKKKNGKKNKKGMEKRQKERERDKKKSRVCDASVFPNYEQKTSIDI